MDHAEYQNKTRTMRVEELYYTMKDCKQAMSAYPDNVNNGYYADEINYCGMELHRRRRG